MKSVVITCLVICLLAACGTPRSGSAIDNYYQLSGATRSGDLAIERIALSFAGGLRSITVAKNAPVAAHVSIRFRGQGTLRGRWLVDGQVVEQVNLTLHHGSYLRLYPQKSKPFPSLLTGERTIQFEVIQPVNPFKTPQIEYRVMASMS